VKRNAYGILVRRGHVACIVKRNAYGIFARRPERKKSLGKPGSYRNMIG
jgi:hypothetical protein